MLVKHYSKVHFALNLPQQRQFYALLALDSQIFTKIVITASFPKTQTNLMHCTRSTRHIFYKLKTNTTQYKFLTIIDCDSNKKNTTALRGILQVIKIFAHTHTSL